MQQRTTGRNLTRVAAIRAEPLRYALHPVCHRVRPRTVFFNLISFILLSRGWNSEWATNSLTNPWGHALVPELLVGSQATCDLSLIRAFKSNQIKLYWLNSTTKKTRNEFHIPKNIGLQTRITTHLRDPDLHLVSTTPSLIFLNMKEPFIWTSAVSHDSYVLLKARESPSSQLVYLSSSWFPRKKETNPDVLRY